MELAGIGRKSREKLGRVLRKTKGPFTVEEAAQALDVSSHIAAQWLSRWARNGWLSRLRRGVYQAVSVGATRADSAVEEPWLLAQTLFSPCYIGGWSAASHWDLTEQIFRTVVVFTSAYSRKTELEVRDVAFQVRRVGEDRFFGFDSIWFGQKKVQISDPSRTMIDLMDDPSLGGGLVQMIEIFRNYVKSEHLDFQKLLQYGDRFGSGSVFKRLGFLIEKYFPDERQSIEECLRRITKGNSKIDPAAECDQLVTRWNLWVPRSWHEREPT